MRDRRNTSLSVCSNVSSSSDSPIPSRSSLNEKPPGSPPPTQHLLLPVTTTKENTSRSQSRWTMAWRILTFLSGLLLFWRCYPLLWRPSPSLATAAQDLQYELTGGDALPDEPIALIVSEGLPSPRWTVSIPHNASFPLHGDQYRDICEQSDELKYRLNQDWTSWRRWRPFRAGYNAHDPNFLDVADAELYGVLPKGRPTTIFDVCERSLTFAMETEEASFGKTLLMLWMTFGLAKKEGRAFFIDDTRWPYGKYTSYFAPPPSQGCSPPPPHQVLPCPHEARHLLVSAATAPWTFGLSFDREFLGSRRYGLEKSRAIYDLISVGYKALFRLTGEDAAYARDRHARAKGTALSHNGAVVGVQIRRGDLHPLEYQFSRDYLPLERYAVAAQSLLTGLLRGEEDVHDSMASTAFTDSPLLLASDDPGILSDPELTQAVAPLTVQKAQDRITLATKAALDVASPVNQVHAPGSPYTKHVDENAGWEGGFYSRLFFSMGQASHRRRYANADVSEQAMRMRELVGRAYLIDLAVLGKSSDGIVCAVSSASCRILGVMMGWDAVVEGRWVNVDDGRPWSWDGRR